MTCKQLIWDYKNGEIICVDNGEVVDKIYDYSPPRTRDDDTTVNTKNHRTAYTRIIKRVMREHRRNVMVYKEVLRLEKRLGDQYIVDEEKYIYQKTREDGKIRYTIKHVKTVEVERSLSKEDWEKVNKGVEMLKEKYPMILSKSLRSRYALGYMFYEYVNNGRIPSKEEITEKMGISTTTYKRLRRQLVSIIPTSAR